PGRSPAGSAMPHRFVIGIGSQRAGSTLLHHLLEASTAVFMHPLKELHYFDTLHGARSPEALADFCRRQLVREIDRIVGATDLGFIDDTFRCYLRSCRMLGFRDVAEIDYIDLFRPFLRKHALLGEVTPEYMLLDDAAVSAMKQVVGADAGVILVCRDPVERLLSAVKLMNVYNNLGMDDQRARDWLEQMLDGNSAWMAAQDAYNDYAGAIARYARHFPHFVAVRYERMVSAPEAVARQIGERLGIALDIDAFRAGIARVANDLGAGFDLGETLRQRVAARYRQQSAFLEEHFGGD
ncbi:MAG: sulfotransferase, partial [Lysobacteraceae bacterium]